MAVRAMPEGMPTVYLVAPSKYGDPFAVVTDYECALEMARRLYVGDEENPADLVRAVPILTPGLPACQMAVAR